MESLLSITPLNQDIDWAKIQSVYPEYLIMSQTPQDPFYHSEGDVWTHTKMVCEELVQLSEYQTLDRSRQVRMFLSTLMHDIAKPAVTKCDNGRVSSKGHSKRGEVDTRIRLWRAGLNFTDREAVSLLIRYHQEPFILQRKENPDFLLHRWSHEINLQELAMLAEADIRGRTTVPISDRQTTLDNVDLFRMMAEDQDCYGKPKQMADAHTQISYFRRDGAISCQYPFYQNSGSRVIVLSGLPASGKNHWVEKNHPDLPVISFDDAREELGLAHGKNDGMAAHHAIDKAKVLLREHQPFIWNSTHLSQQTRDKTLDLLYAYDAEVHIQYLENSEDIILSRNNKRDTSLSNKNLQAMYFKWEVPTPTEAHSVRYSPEN